MSGREFLGSQRAQDVLTCRLCMQYLRDPRQLPCGHSFCLQCLERYHRSECQRSETSRRRSPSAERRRRGLLPCPAAPVCLHVAVVPDDGVAGFPVNQKIADIKEHVVNEMAYNISKTLGRGHGGWSETDAASVRSDETDFSEMSSDTTWSAPAAGSFDSPDGKSQRPNLAKYAKYFESEKDGRSEKSSEYTPTRRSERRRVAISSSFQHRRRRVPTPSPSAFDDSTPLPTRCGSAPHLDSDGLSYRPTVRPRQGSSIASPLLRRARPTSCIIEELADDQELPNHVDGKRRSGETERQTTSTEKRRQSPPLFEHVGLPTHRENISMDGGKGSKPAQDDPARRTEDVKTGNTWSKVMPSQSEPSLQSKHHTEKLEAGKSSRNTTPVSTRATRHHEPSSDFLETGVSLNNAVNMQSDKHDRHYSDNLETNRTSFSATRSHAEPARNSKSHFSDSVKTGRTSVSSRPGRRILPNVPTDSTSASGTLPGSANHSDGVHLEPSNSDVHHARRLPNEKFKSTERHNDAGSVYQQKDPNVSKSSPTNDSESNSVKYSTEGHSHTNKSRSSTIFSGAEKQKTPNSKFTSDVGSSGRASVKSSLSNSVHSKPSTSAKLRDVDHSENSVPSTKPSVRQSPVSQKAQQSRKSSADPNTCHSKSSAASSKLHGSEQVKSSQHADQTTLNSHGSRPVSMGERSRASDEQKKRQSESLAGSKQSPSVNKSRPTKSTPGSGSRLTYKVNAATIQPVLMNRKKTKTNSPDAGQMLWDETGVDDDAEVGTSYSANVEMEEQIDNDAASSPYGNNVTESNGCRTSATSKVSPPSGINDDDCHVDKNCEHDDDVTSVANASQTSQTNVTSADHSATDNCNSDDHFPQKSHTANDDETCSAAAAACDSENAKNDEKKQQQWQDFMATLQAARAKYSSMDNRSLVSQTTRAPPVYSDSITPCWRIHRDDFAVPTCIAIATDGSAIIADVANCLLDFADADGNILHSVTGTKPYSVAIGCNDNVYVGDRRSRTVRVFDIYGSDVAQWDSESSGFGWIAGIAALRNGQLAIVDRERCKVGIYSASGERVTEFGSYGAKDAQLCMADFVAVDSHNRVIVSDSGNHRLKLFDPATGKLVANFAGRGNADECLLWPKGVTVDTSDRIIVADSGNDRVCQFAGDGRFISNLLMTTSRPYHVNYGGHSLLGVTNFELSGASQVDVFAVSLIS